MTMFKNPSGADRPSRKALIALALAFGVLAGACGSTDDNATQQLASVDGAAEEGGPQYGDSLEEFGEASNRLAGATGQSGATVPAGYAEYQWEDLIAPGFSPEELNAQYADQLDALEDGSPEADALFEEMQNQFDGEAINEGLDGTKVNLAGFVAPLTFEDDIVTKFLLVPYFGACIHVPPPPPHQTILVTLDKANGLTIEESWGAVWVAGTLSVSSTFTDIGTSGYTIDGVATGVYDEF